MIVRVENVFEFRCIIYLVLLLVTNETPPTENTKLYSHTESGGKGELDHF